MLHALTIIQKKNVKFGQIYRYNFFCCPIINLPCLFLAFICFLVVLSEHASVTVLFFICRGLCFCWNVSHGKPLEEMQLVYLLAYVISSFIQEPFCSLAFTIAVSLLSMSSLFYPDMESADLSVVADFQLWICACKMYSSNFTCCGIEIV